MYIGEERGMYRNLVGSPEEKGDLENTVIDWRIILKLAVMK
jgi:hypothetical protein